jgi:hypothetical protein
MLIKETVFFIEHNVDSNTCILLEILSHQLEPNDGTDQRVQNPTQTLWSLSILNLRILRVLRILMIFELSHFTHNVY